MADPEALEPGSNVAQYTIMSKLGGNPIWVCYKATDPFLQGTRTVALKLLRPEYSADADAGDFILEFSSIAGLTHPNINPLHSAGLDEFIYYSTAFINGHSYQEQRLNNQTASWFLKQAIAGLEYAQKWGWGITHRNLKPSNFFLDSAKHLVRITDFDLTERQSDVSRQILGSPLYLAPEQFFKSNIPRTKSQKDWPRYISQTDRRTDIYGLGATLFHLMVGRPPFLGDVNEVMNAHLKGPFPTELARSAGVSDGWITILRRMMEKNPSDRYATYAELLDALSDVQ